MLNAPDAVLHASDAVLGAGDAVLDVNRAVLDAGEADAGAGDARDASAEAAMPFQSELAAAAVAWAAAKGTCPTYSYSREHSSVFGFRNSTLVEIKSDMAIRRHFVSYGPAGGPFGVDGGPIDDWDETGIAIGSHGASDFGPYPAETVEQLLSECDAILAKDSNLYYLFFSPDARGVPWTCAFRPKNCFDDCTTGIAITSFSCGLSSGTDGGLD